MEIMVPWPALIALIEPHYPKASKKGGRPPYPLVMMLRVHLLQQWYSLSDPAMEEALIEVPTMRRLAGIELSSDQIPDETTILTFRHLLEKHELDEQIFETFKAHLSAKGMTKSQGTIVDATLIAAQLHLYAGEARVRRRRKNKAGKRDLEMQQSKKGKRWYYRFSGLRLRDESPYRRGQGLRPDPLSCDHGRQCARHHPGQRTAAWR
jgi:IS5 family transposase